MPTYVAIAFSSLSDPLEAFKAAAIDAKTQLNAVNTDLVLVFSTETYAINEGLEILQRILQPRRLLGAMTPGVIMGDRVEMRGVGIMAVISNDLHFGSASLDPLTLINGRDAGHSLGQALLKDHKLPQRSACVYFYDGLRKNASPICAGMREALGNALPIIGAIGMESAKAAHTKHFYQTRVLNDAAVGLLIGGAGIVCTTARHSWQPLGKPRIIDSARGNIILTIDKQPAGKLYEEYFRHSPGKKEASSPQGQLTEQQINDIRMLYPLGLGTSTPREYLVRIPIDIHNDGSIVCQGDVPAGSPVHLMITDKDACRQSMHDAAMDVRDQLGGKQPKFVLIFESFMRRKILGRHAIQGLNVLRETMGSSVPVFGMYTLGEIAPLRTSRGVAPAQLLNGSITLLAIG